MSSFEQRIDTLFQKIKIYEERIFKLENHVKDLSYKR